MNSTQEAKAHFARGNGLMHEGKLDAARASYDAAIACDPGFAEAYSNRGNLYARAGYPEEALANYTKAAMLDPSQPLFHSNRGAMLHRLWRYEEALAGYDEALRLCPDYGDAAVNRGQLLSDMGRLDEAMANFNALLEHAPGHVSAHWNMALLELMRGDFPNGFKRYEWRWKKPLFAGKRRDYPQPLWLGEQAIAGKTLLIHPEQGIGDFLQYCRYVPLLAAQGVKVLLETPAPLVSLMRTLPGATVVAQGHALPPFDVHCPIMSLPLALGTRLDTIPNKVPYLKVPEEKQAQWRHRLGGKTRPRIGVVWSGAAGHVNDHNRSIPLSQFAPLWTLPAEFHALQTDVRPKDAPYLAPLVDHRDAIHDFADTAALVAEMDLIVCVDTSIAHLAGALGTPVWVLLPFAPDFRWLLDRDDSPWYPTMRLFRQPHPAGWNAVIAQVKDALLQVEGMEMPPATAHSDLIAEAFAEALASQQRGDLETAEAVYQEILKLNPCHAESLTNLSSLYLKQHKLEDALLVTERALALNEAQPVLHYNYGRILMAAKLPEEAIRRYDRAIELSPATSLFHSNRGIALFELNRYDEAVTSYSHALAREPLPEYYNNRGNAYTLLMRHDEAVADYAEAVARFPGMGDAHFSWALIELMRGDFASGLKRHEWRWEKPVFAADRRHLAEPLWLGDEALAGKTILIYPEQGLGDVIQFSRYVPLLEARGAKVILEVHAALAELMKTLSPTVTVLPKKASAPPYDVQCPIMSLPLAFGTTLETIPATTPYLSVTAAKRAQWHRRLGPKTTLRVGLAWSGSATHLNDRNRSVPLEQLAPLFALPMEFHSLQLEVRENDRPWLTHVKTHSEAIADFCDTAALVEQMDLIISVDTSVAHLAGALAKPLWMLIPFVPDFRWLLDREDSPWYPTARLFRQPRSGEWNAPVARIAEALARQV